MNTILNHLLTPRLSWFIPQLPMSFQSLASIPDSLGRFQTFQIGLQSTWVVGLLLILFHMTLICSYYLSLELKILVRSSLFTVFDSDAGVWCGSVQAPFLLNCAPNHRAGSKHVPNRAPHRPTPVQISVEWFGAWCTRSNRSKKAFLNVMMDLQVHPDRTYFVTSSKDKMARVC